MTGRANAGGAGGAEVSMEVKDWFSMFGHCEANNCIICLYKERIKELIIYISIYCGLGYYQ